MDTCRICGKEWSTIAPKVHPECVDKLQAELNTIRESLAFSDALEKRQAADLKSTRDELEELKRFEKIAMDSSRCPDCGTGIVAYCLGCKCKAQAAKIERLENKIEKSIKWGFMQPDSIKLQADLKSTRDELSQVKAELDELKERHTLIIMEGDRKIGAQAAEIKRLKEELKLYKPEIPEDVSGISVLPKGCE